MLPVSVVPKGRRQLAPGFNLGTELEKRIQAPEGRRASAQGAAAPPGLKSVFVSAPLACVPPQNSGHRPLNRA